VAALKLAREVKQGLYHRTDECRERRVRALTALKEALLHALPQQAGTKAAAELVALFPAPGVDEAKLRWTVERVVHEHARQMLLDFSRRNDVAKEFLRRGLEREARETTGPTQDPPQ
jgi:hypothetical protein